MRNCTSTSRISQRPVATDMVATAPAVVSSTARLPSWSSALGLGFLSLRAMRYVERENARSGERLVARVSLLGKFAQAFNLLLLRRDMAQALLERGDLAEPFHLVRLGQALAGVGLDGQ